MPTIIDALIVELGLDAGDLQKKAPQSVATLKKLEGQGDKTEKSVGKISKTSKETARGVENLSRVIGSMLSIIGGTMAVKAFINDFVQTNAQLDRFSKNIGLSVTGISAWSNASERLGGSAQGLQGTLDMLSKSQTQLMITGESGLIPYMSALGVSLADVNGKARPVTEILLDLSERFSHMDRTTANNLGRMMGIDQGTMNLLLQGRSELELQIKRQKEQTVVTKAQAEEATRLQKSIVDVKQGFAAFGRSLLMDSAPMLEKVLRILRDFGDWCQQNKEVIEDFLTIITVGLGAIAIASAPISLTVAAVVALAAGIALLWQDYQTWKRGGDSLIDWGKWEPAVTAATNGIKALAGAMELAYEWYQKLYSKVTGGRNFKSDFGAGVAAIGGSLGVKSGANINGRSETASVQFMKKYFTDRGWTDAQASGIAANLFGESGGNMRAVGDKRTAFGLAQWHSDRQANFKKWAGHDISTSTLGEQLGFVQFELTQGSEKAAGDALRLQTTGAGAGAIISQRYERPADAAGEASRRGAYAQSLSGIPGASSVAASAPHGAGNAPMTVDKSVQTQIGEINIHTQATDADGIAKDMEHSLDYLFTGQFNYGLVP